MQDSRFVLKSPFKPQGDQPQAIEALAQGVLAGQKTQVLLGVTGSGKTFTMASVIEKVQKPTLVIAHTVKGCGSAVMENKASWHHKVPTPEEYVQIAADLAAGKERLSHE